MMRAFGQNAQIRRALILLVAAVAFSSVVQPIQAQTSSPVWAADRGDGTYRNPIIFADYSDPDVIRVGTNYYLVASSFNAAPGLPILHSKDLVSWTIIGHALPHQPPYDVFDRPQHGNGVWAPALRFHAGEFFLYYPEPDRGIYLVKAKNPAGPWSEPILVKAAKGWIDPCPFWDLDGKAYLVSAMAGSRSGVKSVLVLSRMAPDGTHLLDDGAIVFDGHDANPTVEGPKLYRRHGYYYIFAPAGGVESGWQLALRSRDIFGPYESRVVLAQGKTTINGPHQGAWIDTPAGQDWFIHFQDRGPFGRVVHLQPMRWVNDWPVMGIDPDGDGTGEPVESFRKPLTAPRQPRTGPADSDEFNTEELGLQWQWQANPGTNWAFPTGRLGFLRLINVSPSEGYRNLWDVPNLLLQKFPAQEFTATTKLSFTPRADGEKTGLAVIGVDYAYLAVERRPSGLQLVPVIVRNADQGTPETPSPGVRVTGNTFYLRVRVSPDAKCVFSYSLDGKNFAPIGESFTARPGKWIGAKVGIFALGTGAAGERGYADFDWFRVE
jgi:beta-xylosidase